MPNPGGVYIERRGFFPWVKPSRKVVALLEQVTAVLDEYEEHLPLTIRQIFYRLVGAYGYEKTETAYGRLKYALDRARRGGRIPFEVIRDDNVTELVPTGLWARAEFWEAVAWRAAHYRRNRLAGQAVVVEVWAEAAGMAPLLAEAVDEYGVAVYSGSGFESITWKHDTAKRFASRDRQTVVLSVGDYDPSGLALFVAAKEDVEAFAEALGAPEPTFERAALTPEQIRRYDLPSEPAKKTDKRSAWTEGEETVQAEALPPGELAAEVRQAVEERLDLDVLNALLLEEERERHELVSEFERRRSDER